MWEKLKQDFRERFLNFETAKGVYLIPAGLATVYASIFHVQYLLQTAGALAGWYLVSEGIRKVWVNRIKQAAETKALVNARLERMATATPTFPAAAGEAGGDATV